MSEQTAKTELAMSCSAPKRKPKSGPTTTQQKTALWSKSEQPSRRLSQAELNAWWPFERLDPKLFPKKLKTTFFPTEEEEALL